MSLIISFEEKRSCKYSAASFFKVTASQREQDSSSKIETSSKKLRTESSKKKKKKKKKKVGNQAFPRLNNYIYMDVSLKTDLFHKA